MHITSHRLQLQQISAQQFTTPNQVVNWMGAMQSQDYEMSKWAVALRLPNMIENKIETALSNGEIIRTHILRPTWHLVSAENLRWMMDLSAPQLIRTLNSYTKSVELNTKDLLKAEKLIQKLLQQKNHCTRDEIMMVLQKEKIKTNGYRSAHIMFHCELNSLVCSGIRKGKDITYALIDERIDVFKKISRDEALVRLATIYFQSHSPATLKDFSWWSGLNQTDAKKGINFILKKLNQIIVGEQTYFVFEKSQSPLPSIKVGITASDKIHLLPAFDEYIISYNNRDAILEKKHYWEVATKNGMFKPIILQNGKIIGTWKRTITGKKIATEIFPFEKISTLTKKEIEIKMDVFKFYQANQ
jgi:hypothetical protein